MDLTTNERRKFRVPGLLEFEAGPDRLPRIHVTSPQAEAMIYLQGAHITSYRPAGQRDLLFLSSDSAYQTGKAIRGGIPVIFPWFGPNAKDPAAPAHGFARTAPWTLANAEVKSDGRVAIAFELSSTDANRSLWPHEFKLTYTIVIGSALELELAVTNSSSAQFTFEEALHTYLSVGDIASVEIKGLGGRDFLDKTAGGRRATQPPGPMKIAAETDRVYLNTADSVSVTDPALARRLTVEKEASRSTVIWNPGSAKAKKLTDLGQEQWRSFVCVESGNAADDAVVLAPGKTHVMRARLSSIPDGLKEDRTPTRQWEMTGAQR